MSSVLSRACRWLAVGVIAVAWLVLPSPSADAAAARTVRWVSPTGTGTQCSSARPCSLARAQAQVRAAVPTMRSDLVVRLKGGTYWLTAPLTFTARDSGRGGHVVRYEAAPGARPVLSGARRITGWKLVDRSRNLWRAAVPTWFTSRQMWVNGSRARIASRPAADVLGPMTTTSTGYAVTRPDIATWPRPTDTELVFPAGGHDPEPGAQQSVAPWTWSMCGVAAARATTVTVDRACFENANGAPDESGRLVNPFISKPTIVQNNRALLGTPGQFYLDEGADEVLYVPRRGENLATASVLMPRLVSLVEGKGTASAPVHDLQIKGLTFEHTTWRPSPTLGVVDIQSNILAAGPNFLANQNAALTTIPAAVQFRRADDVLLERNRVRRVGGAGITFSGGGTANVIRGNVVTDASAGGIQLGDGTSLAHATSYESRSLVSNNKVTRIGEEYQGGVGIHAAWVKHTRIEHNEVGHVPGTGISIGWGWGNPSEMVDNHVDRNYVHDVHQSTLEDGGAIYVNGDHGESLMSTVQDNHVSGDPKPYGALYLDAGASHFMVSGNVVEKVDHGWLYVQNMGVGKPAWSNLVAGNFTDTEVQIKAPQGLDATNRVEANQLGLTSWPAAARAVVAAAGLQDRYADIG